MIRRGSTYSVVRLEVVHLLAKHQAPDVLAQELDDIERVVASRTVPGEPMTTVSALLPYLNLSVRPCGPPYLSTKPCPTRYPSPSSLRYTASLSSSSSISLEAADAPPTDVATATAGAGAPILAPDPVPETLAEVLGAAPGAAPAPAPPAVEGGDASICCVTRYERGTSSIIRKSRQDMLRKEAVGSLAL